MFQNIFKSIIWALLLYSCGVFFAMASESRLYRLHDADIQNYKVWQGRYMQSQLLQPDVDKIMDPEYTRAMGNLSLDEKPLPQRGEVYVSSSLHKKAAHSQAGTGVAYVGPTHANYVQRDKNGLPRYEAFFIPEGKDPQIGKGPYTRREPDYLELYSLTHNKMVINDEKDRRSLRATDTVIVFDAGHGVDHAKTITFKGSNSSRDVRNFTPQNAYYNRYIRMPLVKDAEKRGLSCKELAIYSENPLFITRKCGSDEKPEPIPQGFVFLLLNRGSGLIENSYYFPNFYHYMQDIASIPQDQTPWKFFADRYAMPKKIAHDVWGHDTISHNQARRRAQWLSEMIGYRSLSGRYEVLHLGRWPMAARNALIRTAAIYRMERAAEFDLTIENMLQVAQLFHDKDFRYVEFNGTLGCPHLASYWTQRAYEEVKRKGYTAEDLFFFMQYEAGTPLKVEQMAELITAFELDLKQAPNATHIVNLIKYFATKKDKAGYRKWSDLLSQLVQNRQIPDSIVINNDNLTQLVSALSDTSIVNIILDFAITQENLGPVLEGFRQRAIQEKLPYEENLNFLEFTEIKPDAFESIMKSFEYGISHRREKLFVDMRETTIKLPISNTKRVQTYLKSHYPKTHVTILN